MITIHGLVDRVRRPRPAPGTMPFRPLGVDHNYARDGAGTTPEDAKTKPFDCNRWRAAEWDDFRNDDALASVNDDNPT